MIDCDCFSPSCRRKLEVGVPDTQTAPGMVPIRIHSGEGEMSIPTVWMDYGSISELIRALKSAQNEVRE